MKITNNKNGDISIKIPYKILKDVFYENYCEYKFEKGKKNEIVKEIVEIFDDCMKDDSFLCCYFLERLLESEYILERDCED